MTEALTLAILASALAGFWRLGFSAGLAWALISALLLVLFWPAGAFVLLAITFYGFAGLFRRTA